VVQQPTSRVHGRLPSIRVRRGPPAPAEELAQAGWRGPEGHRRGRLRGIREVGDRRRGSAGRARGA